MTITPSGASKPVGPAAAYLPPALVVLGSIEQLTLGSVGSYLDSNGRGQKKCKTKKGCL